MPAYVAVYTAELRLAAPPFPGVPARIRLRLGFVGVVPVGMQMQTDEIRYKTETAAQGRPDVLSRTAAVVTHFAKALLRITSFLSAFVPCPYKSVASPFCSLTPCLISSLPLVPVLTDLPLNPLAKAFFLYFLSLHTCYSHF